jgi:pimeloyl-ACP methyl ester carboxylesterase
MRTIGAALAALAMLAAGCAEPSAPEAESFTPTFESAPCPVPILPGFPQLNLGPEFSCGYLVVPENRSRPNRRTIKIAVARAKARSADPRPDPLLYLTGGPGGPALPLANGLVAGDLNRDRDLILIDQRGTLHAQPALTCPEIDTFTAAATGMSIQAPSTAEKDLAAVRACRDRLAADGTDLAAFDTSENASDVADLRTALGIRDWNVYGVSYGSDLALQLLRDHPDGIRSLVVDSVAPPQVNLIEQFWPSAAEGLTALFDACTAQPSCARAFPALADEFTDSVNRLAKTPAVVDLPGEGGAQPRRVVIDGYTLANLVVSSTLNTPLIPRLPKAIHAIAGGDAGPAASLVLASVTPPGVVGYGLTYGVFCRENVAFTDTPAILAGARRALPRLPTAVLSLLPQAPRLVDECAEWTTGSANSGRADAAVHAPVRSDVPALLLAGTLDAVTPPSQADLAAEGLPNGRVVRIAGSGHDVISRSTCAQRILVDFLDDPTGYDSACAAAVKPPAFDD